MSLPQYPEYQETGSDWIGKVPIGWATMLLKHGFAIEGGSTPPSDEANWDGQIIWVTPADLSNLGSLFVGDSARKITTTGLSSCGIKLLPPGTVILSTRAPIGSLAISTVTICTNQGCKGLVPRKFISSKYYAYVLLAAKGQLNVRGKGTTFLEISADELGRFEVPRPSYEEQLCIARFLDHETAKIDALIAEQQRLIELLKEKRQAIISHAVTKGLNPNAPMKDSGVEWLGQVPGHWRVGTLRWFATIHGGIALGKEYQGLRTVTLPYLRVANVQNGYVDLSEVKEVSVLPSEMERYSLRPGDVLMNEGGDNDKLGRGTVWSGEIHPCLHQNHVFAIRPGEDLSSEWLATFTQCFPARAYFFVNSKQSTNLASISASNVMGLRLPIPPLCEQREILAKLSNNLAQYDAMENSSRSTIELLKERRSALVSAAVTGRIDVRSWEPPSSAGKRGADTQQPSLDMA